MAGKMIKQTLPTETDFAQWGEGLAVAVVGNFAYIRASLDPAAARVSGSGKSRVLASTRGNLPIPGTEAKAGINVYMPNR